ncbi:hypothetical protein HL666_08820 [Bradyrhizobium sp. 83002]|uniref:hypothetical protein n=1 Tax=Bradyrhizobium aeschynomenes TaxID=2734909 RepID=UPI001554D37D|nr:hypothetical protein [Bradyrhizobium aeschynomenes]NPU10862.1 hypothetical protein [Bradyrhizobium aeschynomenes]
MIFSDFRQPAAAEAYDIALDFLWRTGAVRDEFETYQFLATEISRMVDCGQTNRLRMANLAIAAHQRRFMDADASPVNGRPDRATRG